MTPSFLQRLQRTDYGFHFGAEEWMEGWRGPGSHGEREGEREKERKRERECVFVQEDVSVWV